MCCHPALIKSMIDKEDIDLVTSFENNKFNDECLQQLNNLVSDDEDDDDDFGVSEEIARRVMSRANTVFRDDRRSSKVRLSNNRN